MKPVEEIIGEKILELLHLGLSIIVKPDITIDKVNLLNIHTEPWIENLRSQLKIIIVSNGIDKKMEAYFKEKGITYISFAHKPLKMNFLKACKEMNVQPDKVLVIGDSLFDDVLGGKRNNMKTALVKNVEDGER